MVMPYYWIIIARNYISVIHNRRQFLLLREEEEEISKCVRNNIFILSTALLRLSESKNRIANLMCSSGRFLQAQQLCQIISL